jgi:hypothetical protein
MQSTQTTVRVNLETEQGKRHLKRIEQARLLELERLRLASQPPAPPEPGKPPEK